MSDLPIKRSVFDCNKMVDIIQKRLEELEEKYSGIIALGQRKQYQKIDNEAIRDLKALFESTQAFNLKSHGALRKKLGDLAVEHGNAFKTMKSLTFPRFINIEEVLRELMRKIELVGSYTCNKEQFNYVFDVKYWKETKKKLDSPEANRYKERKNQANENRKIREMLYPNGAFVNPLREIEDLEGEKKEKTEPENDYEYDETKGLFENPLIEELIEKLDRWLMGNDEDGIAFVINLRDEYNKRVK